MDGVTTAILLFAFTCVLFPRLVADKRQFYLGFLTILVAIAFRPFVSWIGVPALIALAVLQVLAVVLLFLAAGGLSARGLTKEMLAGFEVIRRGETDKEIIIPFGEQKQRKTAVEEIGQPTQRYDLGDTPVDIESPKPPPSSKPKDDGPIPMD
ncbi:MAG: hypothetical protein AAGK78_01875 [Planctomycetota bacterium]